MRKGGKHLGWNFKQRVCVLAPPWLLWYVDDYVDADDDAPARGRGASGDGARARSLSPARRRSTRAALKAKTPQKPPRDTGSSGRTSAAALDGATRASLALVDGAAQRAAKALGGELQLTLHHVACDGWSLVMTMAETYGRGPSDGRDVPLR